MLLQIHVKVKEILSRLFGWGWKGKEFPTFSGKRKDRVLGLRKILSRLFGAGAGAEKEVRPTLRKCAHGEAGRSSSGCSRK